MPWTPFRQLRTMFTLLHTMLVVDSNWWPCTYGRKVFDPTDGQKRGHFCPFPLQPPMPTSTGDTWGLNQQKLSPFLFHYQRCHQRCLQNHCVNGDLIHFQLSYYIVDAGRGGGPSKLLFVIGLASSESSTDFWQISVKPNGTLFSVSVGQMFFSPRHKASMNKN